MTDPTVEDTEPPRRGHWSQDLEVAKNEAKWSGDTEGVVKAGFTTGFRATGPSEAGLWLAGPRSAPCMGPISLWQTYYNPFLTEPGG